MRYYLLHLVLILSLGCNTHPKDIDSKDIVNINVAINKKEKNLDKIESITAIKLATDRNLVIGEIRDLVCKGDSIFILDADYSKSIFVFNKEGKEIYTINSLGKGPGEYIRPSRMILRKDNIYLFDKGLGKIIVYNAITGKFNHEFRAKGPITDVAIDDKIIYGYTNNMGKNNIMVFNLKGDKINEYFPTPGYLKNKADFFMQQNFATNAPDVFLMNAFDNNIYRLSEKGFSVKYHVNFGEFNVPSSVIQSSEKLEAGELIDRLSNKYAFGIDFLVNDDEFLSFCYIKGGTNVVIFNKKNGNYIQMPLKDLSKEWQAVFRIPQFASSRGFVSSLKASEMKKFSNMNVENDKALNKLKNEVLKLGDINDNDNPYVLFTKIKSF